MSAFFLRSGFKISIENDNNIKDSEFRDISQYILSNKPFIRQLMTLGFDTLIVTGKTSRKAILFKKLYAIRRFLIRINHHVAFSYRHLLNTYQQTIWQFA